MDYTKRKLLKFTTCAFSLKALGLPIVSTAGTRAPSGYHSSETPPLLESMEAIGKEYLNRYPNEKSRHKLLNLVESRIDANNSGLYGLSWSNLNTMIRDDFQSENIVFLRGWALARTEARLCALSIV